ncbi:MAG: hypothetical protein HY913_01675 [Desulfomonile tiedjei]|nr:hypothetical protein [Desulfomonile tiedjei]
MGDLRAGISYGGGSFNISHNVNQGERGTLVYVDFEFFNHTKKTDLKDGYFNFGGSLKCDQFDFLTVDVQTNFGRTNRFNQFTEAVSGYIPPGSASVYGRYALGVLWLGDGSEGDIYLDSRNRFWKGELVGHIPLLTGWEFLFAYKWTRVKTDIQPASQNYAPGEWGGFQGYAIRGWENGWTDLVFNSNTSFTMSQLVLWHGPYIGIGLANNADSLSTKYYFSIMASPCLFGKYDFDWKALYTDGQGMYIAGSQLTNVTGWRRFGVDLRGGFDMNLSQALVLGANASYSYAYMNGSNPEVQELSNNGYIVDPGNFFYWLAGNYTQLTNGTVTLRQHFWTVGTNLALTF